MDIVQLSSNGKLDANGGEASQSALPFDQLYMTFDHGVHSVQCGAVGRFLLPQPTMELKDDTIPKSPLLQPRKFSSMLCYTAVLCQWKRRHCGTSVRAESNRHLQFTTAWTSLLEPTSPPISALRTLAAYPS